MSYDCGKKGQYALQCRMRSVVKMLLEPSSVVLRSTYLLRAHISNGFVILLKPFLSREAMKKSKGKM